jgi:transposase-like protein
MSKNQKQYTAEFKFQIALEALKGTKTLSELAGQHTRCTRVKSRSESNSSRKEGGNSLVAVEAPRHVHPKGCKRRCMRRLVG